MTEPEPRADGLKIVALRAENVKRLKAVEIRPDPDGSLVVIAGRNAQGKTSVLDAIWLALAGGDASKQTPKPIRDGETAALARLDLGDMVVTRTWNENGSQLNVKAADGAVYGSPQTLLDGLMGQMSFDPLEFSRQPTRKQRETLLSLVELPFDLDELEADRRRIFDERTEINRDVRALEAQLADPDTLGDLPDEEVDVAAVAARLLEIEQQINARALAQQSFDQAGRVIKEQRARVETIRDDVAAMEARLADDEAAYARMAEQRAGLAELEDPVPLQQQITSAAGTNEAVRERKRQLGLHRQAAAVRASSEALTVELEKIDNRRTVALGTAPMPVDGLGFDDEGITYNGIPFVLCSAAEQLRVGVAIAMSGNPRLRVIRITDGSLLDSENLAILEQMASVHGFQVWIERVDETGDVGVTIEDGMVKA